MYIKRFPPNKDGDYKAYICRSVPGSKTREILERYPSIKEVEKEHGDAEKYLKARMEELEKELTEPKSSLVRADLDEKIDFDDEKPYVGSKNLGYVFLQKAYYDLGIEPFLNSWKFQNGLKIGYSLNDAFRLLVFARVEEPCSKLAVSRKTDDYVESFDCTVDDLYDCLDRIDKFSDQLTRKLSAKCSSLMDSKSEAIYYDCTNFYFEVQEEDGEEGLRAYGVEKNHRPDPIVEYGLLLDGNGFPIGSGCFRGNESEKGTLAPLLKNAGEDISRARIIVADNGLNTDDNKELIHRSGRNYIFCQSPKQLSEASLKPLEEKDGWTEYGDGKKIKCWWIKRSNGREERLVARFDPASYAFVNSCIEQRLERARGFIDNPSKLSYARCQDGKEYIRKVVVDRKTGEIIKDKSVLEINEDTVAKDRRFAGYILYVTDIPRKQDDEDGSFTKAAKDGLALRYKTDMEIVEIAGKRNDIEDCFRQMKTGMDAHPIFVRKKEHIRAHLFTVYVALTLMMYLRGKFVPDMTSQQMLTAVRKYRVVPMDKKKDIYITCYYDSGIHRLIEATGGKDFDRKRILHSRIKSLIAKSKQRKS